MSCCLSKRLTYEQQTINKRMWRLFCKAHLIKSIPHSLGLQYVPALLFEAMSYPLTRGVGQSDFTCKHKNYLSRLKKLFPMVHDGNKHSETGVFLISAEYDGNFNYCDQTTEGITLRFVLDFLYTMHCNWYLIAINLICVHLA